MAGMYCMKDLLELLLREQAGELRLQVDKPPVMVVQGELRAIDVPAVTADNLIQLLESIATEGQMGELRTCGDLQFIYVFQKATRFGVSAVMQRETVHLTIRNLGR
jgi:Tfp pilus assembly ATPase PilU